MFEAGNIGALGICILPKNIIYFENSAVLFHYEVFCILEKLKT